MTVEPEPFANKYADISYSASNADTPKEGEFFNSIDLEKRAAADETIGDGIDIFGENDK